MSMINRLSPAADPHMKSKMPKVYDQKAEEFLVHLRQFGQITYAANMTGLTRRTFYARRERDPDFAERWDEALASFEEDLTWRVIHTATEMGTGKWVPVCDASGQPLLDDDFEQVMRFDTSNVDPRITNKLLSLRVRSVNDGPVAVQVNNATHVHAGPRPMPKLVKPSATNDIIDAVPIVETTQGPNHKVENDDV